MTEECHGLPGRGGELLDSLSNAYQLRPGANIQPFVDLEKVSVTHDASAGGYLDARYEPFASTALPVPAGNVDYILPRDQTRWSRLLFLVIRVTGLSAAGRPITVFRQAPALPAPLTMSIAYLFTPAITAELCLNENSGLLVDRVASSQLPVAGFGREVIISTDTGFDRHWVRVNGAGAAGTMDVHGAYLTVSRGLQLPL